MSTVEQRNGNADADVPNHNINDNNNDNNNNDNNNNNNNNSSFSLNRDPPSLKKAKSYDDWIKLMKIWRLYTTIPKSRQGPALLLSLDDEAQEAVLELEENVISSDTGVDNIINRLDGLFRKDDTLKRYNALEEFECYKRQQSTSIQQYIIEFEKRLNKTKSFGTVWSDDLLAYRLLKNANLSENHEQLAKATITNLTFNDMKQKLRNIFGESSNIPTGSSRIKIEDINYTQMQYDQYTNNEE